MPQMLFVYGTLRRGSSAHPLMRDAQFIANASTKGRLFDLGEYPALVRDSRNAGKVRGELYALPDDAAPLLLRELDRYEGSEFVRRRVLVTLRNGKRKAAWTYLLRSNPPKSARLVASGRYAK